MRKVFPLSIFSLFLVACTATDTVILAAKDPINNVLATPKVATKTASNNGHFEGNYGARTYKFIFENVSWHEANDRANAMGATLACIESEAKLNYIQSLRVMNDNISPVWIGLTDSENEGQWQWLCGENLLKKMSFLLDKGPDLKSRNYGHLMKRKGFRSRSSDGESPASLRRDVPIEGYIVEFAVKQDETSNKSIDDMYKRKYPELFDQLVKARELRDQYRGEKELLTSAEEILDQILKENDSFAPAHREMAKVLISDSKVNSSIYHRSQLVLAEQYLYKAIKLEPDYAAAYINLADALTKMKRYGEAKSALLNAVNMGANEVALQLQWGSLKIKQRHYKPAAIHYQVVLESTEAKSIEYRAALSAMTSIYRTQKKYPKALAGYEELITLNPDDAWLWGNYASFLFYRNQDIDGSIDKARKALSLMDYGMARATLAYALYTKWAELKNDADTQAESEQYFTEAYILQPNIKSVIAKLIRNKHTRITATSLQSWLIENNVKDKGETLQKI